MTSIHTRPFLGAIAALVLSCTVAATPVAAQDAREAQPAPLEPTPDNAAHEKRLQNMRARMEQLRASSDPSTALPLMEAQLADMEAMMQAFAEMCPRMSRAERLPATAGR